MKKYTLPQTPKGHPWKDFAKSQQPLSVSAEKHLTLNLLGSATSALKCVRRSLKQTYLGMFVCPEKQEKKNKKEGVGEPNLPWRGRHIHPQPLTPGLCSPSMALSPGKPSAHIQRGLLASSRLGKGQCYSVFDKGLKSKTGAKEAEWESWESGHHDSGQLEVL